MGGKWSDSITITFILKFKEVKFYNHYIPKDRLLKLKLSRIIAQYHRVRPKFSIRKQVEKRT